MPDFFDAETSRVVDITPEQQAGNKTRFQPIGQQTAIMVTPEGKSVNVPVSSVDTALGQGWGWMQDHTSRFETQVDQFKEKNGGAISVGGHEALNQFLMGVPEIAEEHGQGQVEKEAWQRLNKEHQGARLVGGALGVGANVLATGGIGELAEGGSLGLRGLEGAEALGRSAEGAGLGARALEVANAGKSEGRALVQQAIESRAPGLIDAAKSAAVQGMKEGALYSSPAAIAQGAYGDPEHAAETILWGVGTGGLLGLGSGALSSAVGKVRGAASEAAISHGLIDEGGKITDGARDKLKGLVGESVEDATRSKQGAAVKLAEHSEALDQAMAKASGKKVEGLGVAPSDLGNRIQEQVIGQMPGVMSPHGAAQQEALQGIVSKLAEMGSDPMSFSKLNEFKDSIAKAAGSTTGADQQLMRTIEGVVHNEQSKAMAQAFNELPLTKTYADFLGSKMQYGNALNTINTGGVPSPAASFLVNKGAGVASSAIAGLASHGNYVGFKVAKPLVDAVLQHALVPKGLELATNALRGIANGPFPEQLGAALAKDATAAFAQKLQGMASNLTSAGAATARPAGDVVKALLGSKANGLSKDQQYQAVENAIVQTKADPQQVAKEQALMGSAFGHSPDLQTALQNKSSNLVKGLYEDLPKNNKPSQPFEPAKEYKPTAVEKQVFLNKLEVAHNPWAVIDHIADGTLRPEHVEALDKYYPGIKDKFVTQISSMAHDPNTPALSPGVKHGLSMLTGGQPMSAAQSVPWQSAYDGGSGNGGPGAGAGAPPPPPPKGAKGGKHTKVSLPGASSSSIQRIGFGLGGKSR